MFVFDIGFVYLPPTAQSNVKSWLYAPLATAMLGNIKSRSAHMLGHK
jgi:hypothetical protein